MPLSSHRPRQNLLIFHTQMTWPMQRNPLVEQIGAAIHKGSRRADGPGQRPSDRVLFKPLQVSRSSAQAMTKKLTERDPLASRDSRRFLNVTFKPSNHEPIHQMREAAAGAPPDRHLSPTRSLAAREHFALSREVLPSGPAAHHSHSQWFPAAGGMSCSSPKRRIPGGCSAQPPGSKKP
jgi:hypothetical protein